MIKAVFFDWGHTFAKLSENRESKINKVLKPFNLDWQKFHPYWRDFYILRSSGMIKNDKDFEVSIQRAARKKIPVGKIIKITIDSHIIPKDHIKLTKELKKEYKVGILSNNAQEWVDQVIANYRIKKII